MSTIVFILALATVCTACETHTGANESEQLSPTVTVAAKNMKSVEKLGGKGATYFLTGSNVNQTLQVVSRGKNEIGFTLKSDAPCKRTLTGVAVSYGGDYEIDEDEDGVSYPAEEFVYKSSSGHALNIRIAAKERDKARVKEINDKSGCSFAQDLMKRQ